MIPAKTWYKTHNNKHLVIIEVFKTWQHYLKDCKYKLDIGSEDTPPCSSMKISQATIQKIQFLNNHKRLSLENWTRNT